MVLNHTFATVGLLVYKVVMGRIFPILPSFTSYPLFKKSASVRMIGARALLDKNHVE